MGSGGKSHLVAGAWPAARYGGGRRRCTVRWRSGEGKRGRRRPRSNKSSPGARRRGRHGRRSEGFAVIIPGGGAADAGVADAGVGSRRPRPVPMRREGEEEAAVGTQD